MSKAEDEIVAKALNIVARKDEPITDISSITCVMTASKINSRTVTLSPSRLAMLYARYLKGTGKKITDEEAKMASDKADAEYKEIKKQKALEKKRLAGPVGNKYPDEVYLTAYDEETDTEVITDLYHPKAASYIHGILHTVSFIDSLYIYDEKNGIYRPDNHDVSAIIVDMLHDRNLKQSETGTTANIVLVLKGFNRFTKDDYPFDRSGNILMVNNCALEITPEKIIPHEYSPEFMKTVKLPVNYDAKADTSKVVELLESWVYGDDVKILVRTIANGVYNYMSRDFAKKNLMVQGNTDAGKSAYLTMIEKLIGEQNKCDNSLKEMSEPDKFLAQKFEGKIFNIHDEQSQSFRLEAVNGFKKFTGKTSHQMERKNGHPYQGIITCPHIMSCNRPPQFNSDVEVDTAWWGRWDFVSFRNHFTRIPGWERKTFTPEFMSGLLNVVLAKIQKMMAGTDDTPILTSDEVREKWSMMSTPVLRWVDECFMDGTVPYEYDIDKLREVFTNFENEHEPCEKLRIGGKRNLFIGEMGNLCKFVHTKASTAGKKWGAGGRPYILKSTKKYADPSILLKLLVSDGQKQEAPKTATDTASGNETSWLDEPSH